MSDDLPSMSDVRAWFEERGFELALREDSGGWHADLVSSATEDVLAPDYGRGETAIAAANRARSRYQHEE